MSELIRTWSPGATVGSVRCPATSAGTHQALMVQHFRIRMASIALLSLSQQKARTGNRTIAEHFRSTCGLSLGRHHATRRFRVSAHLCTHPLNWATDYKRRRNDQIAYFGCRARLRSLYGGTRRDKDRIERPARRHVRIHCAAARLVGYLGNVRCGLFGRGTAGRCGSLQA